MKSLFVLMVVAAYLIGGIPFGYLIGRLRGVDVRTVGSKNIGATNVFRTVGKKWGLLAFACDVLKGLVPVLIAKNLIIHCPPPPAFSAYLPLAVGITCVLGHMLTPYMKFRGGKGVATALGILIGLVPGLAGVAFLAFTIAFATTNYISLGSCTAAAFLAIGVWFPWLGIEGTANLPQCILVTLLALFVIYKHRANISRLVHGTENKIFLFGKRVPVVLFIAFFAPMAAFAYGGWLDHVPTGGAEIGGPDALDRAALDRRIDAIERATSNAPYIVTRTKSFVEICDSGRLALNTNDLFVHWHPESGVLPGRRERRMRALLNRSPEAQRLNADRWGAENGGFYAHLDTSHTCPDWQSVVSLGPKGLADLQVRVCGWNVRWNDLSRPEQLHFIATAEAQE